MNAVAGLAADPDKSKDFVQALWDLEIPSGQWRYYDGLLYFLALLQVSGNYRIYTPDMPKVVRPTPTPDPVTQAKFVPRGDEVLFSVGQKADALNEYVAATGIEPGGVMLNTTLDGFTVEAANAVLDQHPNSALVLGLDVADSLADINSGKRIRRSISFSISWRRSNVRSSCASAMNSTARSSAPIRNNTSKRGSSSISG